MPFLSQAGKPAAESSGIRAALVSLHDRDRSDVDGAPVGMSQVTKYTVESVHERKSKKRFHGYWLGNGRGAGDKVS